MKRWLCKTPNGELLVYAETESEVRKIVPDVREMKPYTDIKYMEYINKIKQNAELVQVLGDYALRNIKVPQGEAHKISYTNGKCEVRSIKEAQCELYKISVAEGEVYVKLYKNGYDYYDYSEYAVVKRKPAMRTWAFTITVPQTVADMYICEPMRYERYSYRTYGQAKLTKPIELKGITPCFSVPFDSKRAMCQCFIKGTDLWIKHRDFFSSTFVPPDASDRGKPTYYLMNKYFGGAPKTTKDRIYADCWGAIILRNEAWIMFHHMKEVAERTTRDVLARALLETFADGEGLDILGNGWDETTWRLFFEGLSNYYKLYLEET